MFYEPKSFLKSRRLGWVGLPVWPLFLEEEVSSAVPMEQYRRLFFLVDLGKNVGGEGKGMDPPGRIYCHEKKREIPFPPFSLVP